ncbi:cupin [uncultured Kiloniella sp.]|uniref:cupin n=1 Tax=uncultured Kiloniella sp. TaxID=1133091 RepID=UPI0026288C25|nr:cupin [uncultured Kiloniella sp.]
MNFLNASDFAGEKAWDALDLAVVEGASIRLHWTDKPYKWHVNDGKEVFVVLEGKVKMFFKEYGEIRHYMMREGSLFIAEEGEEHVARPQGVARVLVIEKVGSV